MLPEPHVIRRRHLALQVLDEALEGIAASGRRAVDENGALRYDDGSGGGYVVAGETLRVIDGGATSVWRWNGDAWSLADGRGGWDALADLLEPAGDAAYRLARDYHDQPYLSATADAFATVVQDEGRVDADLLSTLRPVDGAAALIERARALGLAA